MRLIISLLFWNPSDDSVNAWNVVIMMLRDFPEGSLPCKIWFFWVKFLVLVPFWCNNMTAQHVTAGKRTLLYEYIGFYLLAIMKDLRLSSYLLGFLCAEFYSDISLAPSSWVRDKLLLQRYWVCCGWESFHICSCWQEPKNSEYKPWPDLWT